MADTISASQGPRNPRLKPELLNKQQVSASESTITTHLKPPYGDDCAHGGQRNEAGVD